MKQIYNSSIKSALLFLFILSFIVPQIVLAERYQSFHRGVRPLGMGGAFTAVADDHNAIFYNPAGLGVSEGTTAGFLNPYISASEDFKDFADDYDKIDTEDTGEVSDLLDKYLGESFKVKVAADIYSGFHIGNVGVMVSAIGHTDADITIHNPVWPEAYIKSVADYGMLLGAGLEIPSVKGLRVGGTIKAISRESLDKSYTATDIADSDDFGDKIEDDMESGTGASIDLGVLYSVEGIPFTDLDIAFTGQNLPEMDFGSAIDGKSQFNLGAAFKQKFGMLQLTEAIDYMDITDNLGDDESIEKKLHFGVEAEIPVVSVRIGLNQGYFTYGATVDLWMLRLDMASFGEEVGVYGGQKEDRQYAAQLSLGWDW